MVRRECEPALAQCGSVHVGLLRVRRAQAVRSHPVQGRAHQDLRHLFRRWMVEEVNETTYYGLRADVGYDGVLRRTVTDDTITMEYLTANGWIEDESLLKSLQDGDVMPIEEDDAQQVSQARFGKALP